MSIKTDEDPGRNWGRLWRTECPCGAELVTPGTEAGHLHELVLDGWRRVNGRWLCDACLMEE